MKAGGLLAVWAVLGCGDDTRSPATNDHIFEEITEAAFPGDLPVPVDGTEYVCDTVCPGTQTGVGAAAADVDGDGKIDLYLAGPDGGRLLLNRWPAFQPAPLDAAGVYVHGAAFGDLDGDGDPDLLLATAVGLRVYENVGGQFHERTELRHASGRLTGVTVGDLNNDGVLDVHVSEYGNAALPTAQTGAGLLWLGHGDFTFDDVTSLLPPRHTWSSLMADLDRDGNLDLFLAAETWYTNPGEQHSSLYFNGGSDDSGRPLLDDTVNADALSRYTSPMGAAVGDPDGDGEFEMLVSMIGPSIFLDHEAGTPAQKMRLTSYFGAQKPEDSGHTSWAIAFEDFDHDGHLDALLAGGAPCIPEICMMGTIPIAQTSVLYRFDQGIFDFDHSKPVPLAGGIAPADATEFRGARGIVLADLDGDGRDELLLTPFRDRFRLYRNVAPRGHYLRVLLRGTVSAVAPYGAEVTVTAGAYQLLRPLVSGGTPHSSGPPMLTFELGSAAMADKVDIRWPSGVTQTLTSVQADQTLAISEPRLLEVPSRQGALGGELSVFIQRQQPNDDPTGIDIQASDGVPFVLESLGNGRFRAHRAAPAAAGPVRIALTLDGLQLRTRPIVWFR